MPDLTRNAVDVLPEGRLAEQLEEGRPLRVKLGIDPTTADIHLGHTVVLEKLAEFQRADHQVVLIIGDFTAQVGDPSGRSATRPVPSAEEIEANAATYQEQAFKILDREKTEVRRNSEWLRMEPEALLGLLARTTVARLLERDDFQKRMATARPIAALELLYPLLQGYDSVAVEADVELGGTDQKFNLLFGRDVQTSYGQKPQSIMTLPILVGTDGVQKMSKSLGNYVGVTDAPEEMFGRLMSIPDEAMPEYYRLLLGSEQPASPPNEAKRELGRRIVDRFHGEGAGTGAEEHFNRVHVQHAVPDEIPEIELGDHRADGNGLVHLPRLIADAFDVSSSEGRRLIQQGAVKLDGEPLPAEPLDLETASLDGRVLQVGKRRFCRLRATP
ncbi:MAG TPA: tyrosine--tRNA ligase [Solirubrobacterales bacterium]|jgi:tyrosyl-tRNA synthetase|nr:tyrosine--tRNA ligase [Solirubrobacterales bacterium]